MRSNIILSRILSTYRKLRNMRMFKIILIGGVSLAALPIALYLVVSHFPAGRTGSSSPPAAITNTFQSAGATDSRLTFDRPLYEKHVALPLDPKDAQSKPTLTCYYYPHFMVKEVDDPGQIGAGPVSIISFNKDAEKPECDQNSAQGEQELNTGSFQGAKDDFVFFDTDEEGEGDRFDVFSAEGVKIFEDSSDKMGNITAKFIAPKTRSGQENDDHTIVGLSYQRVYPAPCSLRSDAKNCWERIQKVTGLTEKLPQACAEAYENAEKGLQTRTKDFNVKDFEDDPSVIVYEVEVVLDSRNSVLRAAPISKVTACYPAE